MACLNNLVRQDNKIRMLVLLVLGSLHKYASRADQIGTSKTVRHISLGLCCPDAKMVSPVLHVSA